MASSKTFIRRRDMLHLGLSASLYGLSMTSFSDRAHAASGDASPAAEWARPIDLAGVPNLHRVAPNLYRSAQPTREGFAALHRELGLRNVISLRRFHADDVLAGGQNLLLTRIPMNTWDIDEDKVVAALRALRRAQKQGPVLVHCQHGADRTGLIIALYRIVFQGWSKADALAEMRKGDFGYHAIWGNIPAFIERANIPALKTAVMAP